MGRCDQPGQTFWFKTFLVWAKLVVKKLAQWLVPKSEDRVRIQPWIILLDIYLPADGNRKEKTYRKSGWKSPIFNKCGLLLLARLSTTTNLMN